MGRISNLVTAPHAGDKQFNFLNTTEHVHKPLEYRRFERDFPTSKSVTSIQISCARCQSLRNDQRQLEPCKDFRAPRFLLRWASRSQHLWFVGWNIETPTNFFEILPSKSAKLARDVVPIIGADTPPDRYQQLCCGFTEDDWPSFANCQARATWAILAPLAFAIFSTL